MVWRDLQLGPSGSPRPDVFTLFKSFVNPQPTSYEVKASKADFRADATAGKWMSYLAFSSRVYFACEAGLLTKADVPQAAGLITLRDGRWTAIKRPIAQHVSMPQEVCLKLLIDGVGREGPVCRRRGWSESATIEKLRKEFGDDVAAVLRDLRSARVSVEYAKREADRIVESARDTAKRILQEANVSPQREELCSVLGLPVDAPVYAIKNAVRQFSIDRAAHPAVRQLHRIKGAIDRLSASIDTPEEPEEELTC